MTTTAMTSSTSDINGKIVVIMGILKSCKMCSDCLDCAGWFKPVIFWSVTGGLAGLLSLLVIGKIRKGREGFKEKKDTEN